MLLQAQTWQQSRMRKSNNICFQSHTISTEWTAKFALMPLNYTIPALNTCDASPYYCAALPHFMLDIKYIFATNSFLFCGKRCINLCILGSKSSGGVNPGISFIAIEQGGSQLPRGCRSKWIYHVNMLLPSIHSTVGWELWDQLFSCAKALLGNTQLRPFTIGATLLLTSVSWSRRSRHHLAHLSLQASFLQWLFSIGRNQALLLQCFFLLLLLLLDSLLELL